MQKSNEFRIIILSKKDIDADILGKSLIHISTLIKEISYELKPELQIDLKIKDINKGSIELLYAITHFALTPEFISYAANIIQVFVGILDIKKFLNGEEGFIVKQKDSPGSIGIGKNNGEVKIVNNNNYNISITPGINSTLTKILEEIGKDPTIAGFAVTDKDNKKYIELDRLEIVKLSLNPGIIKTTLTILSISFQKNSKSVFYFNGLKIRAKILDDSFNAKILNGEQFASGDTLVVELKINTKIDEITNTVIVKSYDIIKVIEHLINNNTISNEETVKFGATGVRKININKLL